MADQTVQGYRGVNINTNTQDNKESLGEMHMKDYIYIFYIDVTLIKRTERTRPQFAFSHLV